MTTIKSVGIAFSSSIILVVHLASAGTITCQTRERNENTNKLISFEYEDVKGTQTPSGILRQSGILKVSAIDTPGSKAYEAQGKYEMTTYKDPKTGQKQVNFLFSEAKIYRPDMRGLQSVDGYLRLPMVEEDEDVINYRKNGESEFAWLVYCRRY